MGHAGDVIVGVPQPVVEPVEVNRPVINLGITHRALADDGVLCSRFRTTMGSGRDDRELVIASAIADAIGAELVEQLKRLHRAPVVPGIHMQRRNIKGVSGFDQAKSLPPHVAGFMVNNVIPM